MLAQPTSEEPPTPARPQRVLHRAGNLLESLPLAERHEVDAIEADVWVRSGILVAHHDRPVGPLPVTLGPRGPHYSREERVNFEQLLSAVDGIAELIVDLRSWFGDPAPDVARALLPLPDRSNLRVTCESWTIADRLAAWLPDLRVAYSIRRESQLRRYALAQSRGELAPADVTVNHRLLRSRPEVESLRRWARWIGVWTVDEPDRVRELASWGVDAITSNSIEALAAI